jgi:cytochrome c
MPGFFFAAARELATQIKELRRPARDNGARNRNPRPADNFRERSMNRSQKSFASMLLAGATAALFATGAQALDVDAAKDLMKQNKCTQCHGMDKDKDGPAFKKVAAKFKGKADSEAKLVTHLTTAPKVKLSDGTEEEHKVVKTTPAKDEAQVRNLVQYILTL